MRPVLAFLLLVLCWQTPVPCQPRPVDFTGVWKLETSGAVAQAQTLLILKMDGKTINGKLKTPHGEFPLENGLAEGQDLFFNVVIERDEYRLKTTYRGHLFSEEIQFTVEAGERMLQVIARREE